MGGEYRVARINLTLFFILHSLIHTVGVQQHHRRRLRRLRQRHHHLLVPLHLYPPTHPISLALSPAITAAGSRAPAVYIPAPSLYGSGAPRSSLIGNGPIFGISAHSLRDPPPPPPPPPRRPRFTAPGRARGGSDPSVRAGARRRRGVLSFLVN